jgi:N-acetylneuraminic acid mutarotase
MKTFPRALAIGLSILVFVFAWLCPGLAQVPFIFAKLSSNLFRPPPPKQLSLADRVAYQSAIEEIYWRHRIWPKENGSAKPPLDEVMSPAQVRQKVEDYLRNSRLLGEEWQQPITPEHLQREMERMARDTKQPEVLRELFDALDNDPGIIAECLARPVLTERLVSERLSGDERLGEPAIESKRRTYRNPAELKNLFGAQIEKEAALEVRNDVYNGYTLPPLGSNCTNDTWTATSTTNAPSKRWGHTAVWTGSEMIVWGGTVGLGQLKTGGRYNPATDSWTATTLTGVPPASALHTAVWTGVEMIVWGGAANGNYQNTGGRYNPSTDSWVATSMVNVPSARYKHTAVWTGNQMIVWGGSGSTGETNTGGLYNPSTDSWTATTTTNAPSVRQEHTAVWTGSEMIIWAGYSTAYINTGGRYNPLTDSWVTTSLTNAPNPRGEQAAVWTGTEMIIWGGSGCSGVFNSGGRYNPIADSWNATALSNAPAMRRLHTATWTGSEMIIWAGYSTAYINTGGRYNPLTDSWVTMTGSNVPDGRASATAIWTGSEMIVWGGYNNSSEQNTGGKYCAQPPAAPTPCPACSPTPTPTPTATPAFSFVPGNYYTSTYTSRVITQYDSTRNVVGSYTVPCEFGDAVKGLAFSPDGLLYAAMPRGSTSFAVVALRSDGSVAASYPGSGSITGNLSYGKIAMDNQYLYVGGPGVTRFLLGNPFSGTTIYTGSAFDVKPLPNGHLFVASASSVEEITSTGTFVRRIQLTGGQSFYDIRGIEYNPATNILFVTHRDRNEFDYKIMRVNATTGALLSSVAFSDADDLFVDSRGNLLVGSRSQIPTFYSQDLVRGNTLNGGQQIFVTQYAPAQALNISTRLRVETGNNVLIGGFIINGTAPKNIAVRGIGPSLTQFGVPDALADPVLELHDSSGALVQQNDNWQDDPSQAGQLSTLGLAPQNPSESGIVASVSPAAYTAILAGKNGGTGVALVEIYDTNSSADSQLANISTRGFVLTGNNVMIGGFVLGGANNTHVVVRGLGPSLAQFGLSPVLDDPTLELRDSNGALLVSNDNWQDDPVSAAQLTARGLAPTNPAESGILVSQYPGAFTAILAGKNGGTGIGLVEVYNVH